VLASDCNWKQSSRPRVFVAAPRTGNCIKTQTRVTQGHTLIVLNN
jgi:hypothetical protein